jgi:signal transduction histidine kinase
MKVLIVTTSAGERRRVMELLGELHRTAPESTAADLQGALRGSFGAGVNVTMMELGGVEPAAVADRFAVLGRTAAGAAHDLANYFTVVDVVLERLRRSVTGAGPAAELEEARAALASATELVRGLLAYARGGPPASAPLDLSAVVRRAARFLARVIPCTVRMMLDLDGDLPRVQGVAVELEQVVLNLVLNACDAMPDGGMVRLATRAAGLGAVMLEVTDTGCGLTADGHVAAGATTPSTKPGRHGTGLGLGIVRSVIARHGALLCVAPRAGGGTRARVLFSTGRDATTC